ncbi:hypothetical protein E2562_015164 [Oryza meyeriana var. granulata]|uniref:Uncharacterized protein n=1 Tax=Oryza meyeriana var. granulata TaxID=110450 RepID=A0A6G1EWN1_9ORYZ|nr:hypothetical protein E2562_015164 [Oryza meyeriana var. granulata]
MPTKCSMACPNNSNIVGVVNLTPTKCSIICSRLDTNLDITMAVVVMSATACMASMEMVIGEDETGITYINTPNHPKVVRKHVPDKIEK